MPIEKLNLSLVENAKTVPLHFTLDTSEVIRDQKNLKWMKKTT